MLHVSSPVAAPQLLPRATRCDAPLVVIHTHPLAPLLPIPYMVRELLPYWRAMGISAACVPAPVHVPSAAAALLHIDSTRPIDAFRKLSAHYPATLNAKVGSIEKRLISRHQVRKGEGYDGPVIVKTNLNFGGAIDYQISRESHPLRTCMRALRQRMPWQFRTRLDGKDYRIFDRAADVPMMVWHNEHLIVERLLCERAGDQYVLRSWVFFGDGGFISVNYATTPIVQARTIVTRKIEFDPPPELLALRQSMHFDFGKFDFTIIDGVAHLLDANTTPTVGNFSKWPWFDDCMRRLAPGIQCFLK